MPSRSRKSSNVRATDIIIGISFRTANVMAPSLIIARVTCMRSSGNSRTWLSVNTCCGINAVASLTVISRRIAEISKEGSPWICTSASCVPPTTLKASSPEIVLPSRSNDPVATPPSGAITPRSISLTAVPGFLRSIRRSLMVTGIGRPLVNDTSSPPSSIDKEVTFSRGSSTSVSNPIPSMGTATSVSGISSPSRSLMVILMSGISWPGIEISPN